MTSLRLLPRPRLPTCFAVLQAAFATTEQVTPTERQKARRELAERMARWSRKSGQGDWLED